MRRYRRLQTVECSLVVAAHHLATVGMALTAGVDLGSMAFVALVTVQIAMRALMRVVLAQIRRLFCQLLVGTAMAGQALVVVDVVAIGQAQVVRVASQLRLQLGNLHVKLGGVAVQTRRALVLTVPCGEARAVRFVGTLVVRQVVAHGIMAHRAAEARRVMPYPTAAACDDQHRGNNAHHDRPALLAGTLVLCHRLLHPPARRSDQLRSRT